MLRNFHPSQKASALFILIGTVGFVSANAQPKTMTFQGVLTDTNRVAVADGDYSVEFMIYDQEVGGVALWTEGSQLVSVIDGLFHVTLGESVPLELTFDTLYYLGIKIGADQEIAPRTPLRGTPYSFRALSIADSSVSSGKLADFAVTPSKLDTTGAGAGQVLQFDGSDIVWSDPLAVPYVMSGASSPILTVEGEAPGVTAGLFVGRVEVTDTLVARLDARVDGFLNVITGTTLRGNTDIRGDVTIRRNFQPTLQVDDSVKVSVPLSLDEDLVIKGSILSNELWTYPGGGVAIGSPFVPDEQLHVREPSGSTGIKLGGNGTPGPHGIIFEDDVSNDGVQLFWRTSPNRLVLERTSEGTDVDGTDAFFYDRGAQRFVFSGARSQNASFDGHLVGFDNTASGSPDGIAIRLGESDAGSGNNFISFFDGDNDAYGRIEGNGSNGVSYLSTGGDYAEFLPRQNPIERMQPGDVVAVTEHGIARDTRGGGRYMVITGRPGVAGNMPQADDEHLFEKVAFVGQVPVNVRGPVEWGDFIVPSSYSDGTAVAIPADRLRPDYLSKIVGVAWEASDQSGVKQVMVEVGLDRARATQIAFENELREMRALLASQQKQLEKLASLHRREL